MAEVQQWVNLTVNKKWKGDGVSDVKQMGLWVNVKFKMAQKKRATLYVTKKADGDNAAYSANEKKRRPGFRPREFTKRRFRTDKNGILEVKTTLTLAGGDKFTFEGEDKGGKKVKADTFVTRRKLYFQIICMVGAPRPGTGAFKGEFWKPGKKLFIKMVQFSPRKTIPSRINMDDTDPAVENLIKSQARGQYDKSKKPYSFVTLVVRKNCIHGPENMMDPGVSFAGNYTLTCTERLMDVADPAEEWYVSIVWQDHAGGPPFPIAKNRCARAGLRDIVIDTTGLPQGVPGDLTYNVRVIEIEGMGFSLPTDNLTLVATECADGTAVPIGEVENTINLEVGHKIGVVPGPEGTRALDEQGTYYDNRGHAGGHCHQGVGLLPTYHVGGINPTCTMFGDTRSSTGKFCGDCLKSLRKLDLRSSTNVGIRTQF